MKSFETIKINFCGGIISPGELYNILVAVGHAGVLQVKFGLRQQMLIDTIQPALLMKELELLGVKYECDADEFPNVVSSYPAEEIFITNTWLSEGVYKDIFDLFDYQSQLKINISDSNQSFTPMLTGNINWVASPTAQHFWHLFIRFPKTNVVYEWKDMLYTNDLVRMSKLIESLIFLYREQFCENEHANGDSLYHLMKDEIFITQSVDKPLKLPGFNLPYYEGLNRYNEKSWLGIYRRDELFPVQFLKEVCLLCLETKIGQICSTPWKSLIIKAIEEKNREQWSNLLAKHQVNVRHAANELNFQVEDNCREGIEIKKYLVSNLHNDDIRTFGVCIGIKTRKKSEVFSSILVRQRPLLRIGNVNLFNLYDILCAKDFNPNERTGFVFSSGNPKFVLAEQLRKAILAYNYFHEKQMEIPIAKPAAKEPDNGIKKITYVNQCIHCHTVYDDSVGEPENGIKAGTLFAQLSQDYCCPLCEAGKEAFVITEKHKLGLQPV
jgi:rubredoxin